MNQDEHGEESPHQPVLYQLSLDSLQPHDGGCYVDATLGAGGHASGILQRSAPDGLLLGLDVDEQALKIAAERLAVYGNRATLKQASYATLHKQVNAMGWKSVDGILFDLGVSSMQLDTPERGFSFLREGPLDMRFDTRQTESAEMLVNHASEEDLAEIFWKYGEEHQSRKVAIAICTARPIKSTLHLAEVISVALGGRHGKHHPATRCFQAIRMAVNNELTTIEKGLEQAIAVLKPGGRVAVITFHSLEDRVVKRFFQQEGRDCICQDEQPVCVCGHRASIKILTKHPQQTGWEEARLNPRARSAKLRVAEKL